MRLKLKKVEAALIEANAASISQVCLTEPQAHVMKLKEGDFGPAYNVQTVTEGEFGLVVYIEVTTNGSDGGRLQPNIEGALKEAPSLKSHFVVADAGYHSAKDLSFLESRGLCPLVSERGVRLTPKIAEAYQAKHFSYFADKDAYQCPEGQWLDRKTPIGKEAIRYRYYGAPCSSCPSMSLCCQGGKLTRYGRSISHNTLFPSVDRNRANIETADGKLLLKRRAQIAEGFHARLKSGFGLRRFRSWGLQHVQSEIQLAAFCLNTVVKAGVWRPIVSLT